MADRSLHSFYANKFEGDARDLALVFSGPNGASYGLLGVNPLFWIQLFVLILLESLVNVAAAVVIYSCIIKRRGSTSAYLVGYGFLCPLLLYVPFHLVYYLDLRNTALKIGSAAAPSLLFFRCLEAMHGTAPAFATKSMESFVLYYVATVQFQFDSKTEKPLPALRAELASKAVRFHLLFVQVALLFSVLIPYNYRLFPRRDLQSPLDLFYWGNIGNNFLMASLTSCCLEVGATGVGLVMSLLSGFSTVDVNDNPLTKSTSPSDFWGRRWNRLNSSSMKRGVYQPMCRVGYSKRTAALATFAASGLLHEYILVVMTANSKDATKQDEFLLYGSHLAFFLWNGTVLILEHLLKDLAVFKWTQRNLPAPVQTFLVLLTVLPVATLFTEAYIVNGFYSDYAIGFPRLVHLVETSTSTSATHS
jgi:hypothetical protein